VEGKDQPRQTGGCFALTQTNHTSQSKPTVVKFNRFADKPQPMTTPQFVEAIISAQAAVPYGGKDTFEVSSLLSWLAQKPSILMPND